MATRIKLDFDAARLNEMRKLRKMFPDFSAQALTHVGRAGKAKLKNQLLSGQEIRLSKKKMKRDKLGRRTVQYSVGKRAKHVRISSYPVNLFEKGRMLRSGAKEPGKYILTRKLKNIMAADLQGLMNEFDKGIFQQTIDRIIK